MIDPKELLTNYKVYPDGSVFSYSRNRFLKVSRSTEYPSVVLCKNNVCKRFNIHRLIAILYIPNPENKPCVNHIDGNKSNNQISNLEWCTYQENERHSIKVLGKKISHSAEARANMSISAKGRDMTAVTRRSAEVRRLRKELTIKE